MSIRWLPRKRSSSSSARLRLRPRLESVESRLAPAVVTGFTFSDLNGDGVRQNSEGPMPGVTVYLDVNNNGKFDPPAAGAIGDPFAKSGQDGKYFIQTGFTGTVTVAALTPTGFKATTSSTTVTLGNTPTTTIGPNFGFQLLPPTGGVIRGHVFNDSNSNGALDPNEPGVSNVIVFLDLNNNGKFDPPSNTLAGEPSVKSLTTGVYEIKAPGDGQFSVTVLPPAGQTLTTPASGAVSVSGGAQVAGPNFGLKAPPAQGGYIFGTVFNDKNGDGIRQNTEPGMGGVLVYLDLNNNGKFDPPTSATTPGEPAVGTGTTGGYVLKAPADGTVTVAVLVPPGLTLTTPGSSTVTVSAGAQALGPNFGLQAPTTPPQGGLIRGTVFSDLNSDGIRQNTEPGIGGVTIFLDLNNNGQFDGPTTGTVGEPAVKSAPSGVYEIKSATDGKVRVAVVVPPGLSLTTPGSGEVTVAGGQQSPGPNFGLLAPPPTGGVVTGHVFVDFNGDGVRQNTESGQLGVVVFLDLNGDGKFNGPSNTSATFEPFSVTGKEGRYEIKVAKDGVYPVLEVVPQGFKQTAPTSVESVNITGGAIVAGPAFGNQPPPPPPLPGAVTGRVFRDVNANGKLDQGEPGLFGVRVFDDVNDNGKFDSGELFTLSGPGGQYIMLLPPGAHNIDEVIPTGLVETVEPGTVLVVSGQITFDQHFGLAKSQTSPGLAPLRSLTSPRGWNNQFGDDDTSSPSQVGFLGGVPLV